MVKNELGSQEIKNVAFSILKHFNSFCKDNHIQYFLSNGTLLGAVKYKGFIPWDDDIDVLVPRDDYDKLIEIYQNSEKYKLFSVERVPEYRYTFAKLCDMSTLKIEENINNGVALGVDIDIFPLDNCTVHILKPNVIRKFRQYQIACVLSKYISSCGKCFYKKCIITYCRIKGNKYFVKKLISLVSQERKLGDSHKGCIVWPVYGEREIIPAEFYSDIVEVEFEGEKFPAPIGYDKYLRSLYGEYEQDPPLDKQKSHHSFKAFRIEN